jgi:hypothetical protein
MRYIGIDPGKAGAVSAVDTDGTTNPIVFYSGRTPLVKGKKKDVYDVPGMLRMLTDLDSTGVQTFACIEKAQPMPGQGVTSMFSIGYGYGLWIMALTTVGIPYMEARPAMWMKEMFLGMPNCEKKQNSIIKCTTEFADSSFLIPAGCRTPHDGIADATCLALYAMSRRGTNDNPS